MNTIFSLLESGNVNTAASVLMDEAPSIAALTHSGASREQVRDAIMQALDMACEFQPSARKRCKETGKSSGCLCTWGRRSVRGGAR